jgi:hypothetical protein
VKEIRIQTAALDAKCNRTSAFYHRLAPHFGHTRLGTPLGTFGAFFTQSVQKTEGKRGKATVSLTVAFFAEKHG